MSYSFLATLALSFIDPTIPFIWLLLGTGLGAFLGQNTLAEAGK